jgi:plastocyanin
MRLARRCIMLRSTFCLLVVTALTVSGCQGYGKSAIPEISRTANVHTVKVDLTEISPAEMTVGVGDEILFVNDRTQPLRIILIEGGKWVACQRGFSGIMDQEAEIAAGRSASFCFDRPGTVKYMARSKGGVEGAEMVLPGQIHVERAGAAAPVQAKDRRVPAPPRESEAGITLSPEK